MSLSTVRFLEGFGSAYLLSGLVLILFVASLPNKARAERSASGAMLWRAWGFIASSMTGRRSD